MLCWLSNVLFLLKFNVFLSWDRHVLEQSPSLENTQDGSMIECADKWGIHNSGQVLRKVPDQYMTK